MMSNLGKHYIKIPDSVKINFNINNNLLYIEGKLGKLNKKISKDIRLLYNIRRNILYIRPKSIGFYKNNKMFWGLNRSIIYNMIKGVNQGFTSKLIFIGIGYRAKIENNNLILKLGFSHLISYKIPKNIKITILKLNIISVFGYNKQLVHNISSLIRQLKKPEPYKGKGIRWLGENLRTKEGKRT